MAKKKRPAGKVKVQAKPKIAVKAVVKAAVKTAVEKVKAIAKFDKKELGDFRKLIVARRTEIIDDLGDRNETMKQSQKEASGDISGYTYHMADVATDNYDREFSLGIASNERQLLYELDDALKRIEDGSYGLCEECKRVITKTRLKAIPYTRHCLSCQEKREKK